MNAKKTAQQSMTEEIKEAAAPEPTETWNQHWGIRRRMLEARKLLRGTQLWQKFSLQRDFDAFSIHPLARGVEEILGQVGVISSFSVTKWSKGGPTGNVTIVEGIVQFVDVDNGEVLEYPTVGEGIDNGDKGIGKAVSYARKMGLISGMNLGIGVDNEATDTAQQPNTPPGPPMSGEPQQKTAPPAAKATGANGAHVANKTYTFQQEGLKARAVLGSEMMNNCWAVIQATQTVSALDIWGEMNKEMLENYIADDPAIGGKIRQLYMARRTGLEAKGLI